MHGKNLQYLVFLYCSNHAQLELINLSPMKATYGPAIWKPTNPTLPLSTKLEAINSPQLNPFNFLLDCFLGHYFFSVIVSSRISSNNSKLHKLNYKVNWDSISPRIKTWETLISILPFAEVQMARQIQWLQKLYYSPITWLTNSLKLRTLLFLWAE